MKGWKYEKNSCNDVGFDFGIFALRMWKRELGGGTGGDGDGSFGGADGKYRA